ncbi:unnamed protein product [Strongylus vulgaris]|uniref:Uncharacterized protein n=1 Tax=Strongylus vulgaris TaxID=40348 RepID=A0A3P7IHQ6_STRVU|nr:unnamed protein product [Strongylus vulgaris]
MIHLSIVIPATYCLYSTAECQRNAETTKCLYKLADNAVVQYKDVVGGLPCPAALITVLIGVSGHAYYRRKIR